VFRSIREQTGYSFVYNNSDVDRARRVTLDVTDQTLPAVLDRLFDGSDIAYTIKDKHIILSKKSVPQPSSGSEGGGISGSVRDAEGVGLIGASVIIKGTTTGAAVDVDGNFVLPQARPGDILVVSLIGYQTLEIPVTGQPLQIVLKEENENARRGGRDGPRHQEGGEIADIQRPGSRRRSGQYGQGRQLRQFAGPVRSPDCKSTAKRLRNGRFHARGDAGREVDQRQ